MSDSTGYEIMMTEDGNILQSGARSRAEVKHRDVDNVQGWITRAVVLQTYYADEDSRSTWLKTNQKCVLCDVRTYGRYSRPLFKVPVLQRSHGLWDADIYVPRGSKVNIEGGACVPMPSDQQGPTSAERLDGDHVLIGFMDNDPQQPVILPFVLAHPASRYTPKATDGRVRRIRHNGVLVEWDKDANFKIDATGAAKADLLNTGAEVSNSGIGGQVTLVTTNGVNQTSIHLNAAGQILLGSNPATPSSEPLVLGNLWISIMDELIDAIKALTVGTGTGPSSTPINFATFDAIKSKIDQKLHVSDFIFARKTY